MRIAIFGATGQVGGRAAAEALSRGHDVTGVVRDPGRVPQLPAGVRPRVGDAANPASVADVSAGHDLVISATRPPEGREGELVTTTRSLLAGLTGTGVRLLIVGGAASLRVPGAGGATVLDDPRYLSDGYRDIALACNDQLAVCRAETAVEWTYLSPPAWLEPGERTGSYRPRLGRARARRRRPVVDLARGPGRRVARRGRAAQAPATTVHRRLLTAAPARLRRFGLKIARYG